MAGLRAFASWLGFSDMGLGAKVNRIEGMIGAWVWGSRVWVHSADGGNPASPQVTSIPGASPKPYSPPYVDGLGYIIMRPA